MGANYCRLILLPLLVAEVKDVLGQFLLEEAGIATARRDEAGGG